MGHQDGELGECGGCGMESSHVLGEGERPRVRQGDGESKVVDVSEIREGDYEFQVENTVDFGREREID